MKLVMNHNKAYDGDAKSVPEALLQMDRSDEDDEEDLDYDDKVARIRGFDERTQKRIADNLRRRKDQIKEAAEMLAKQRVDHLQIALIAAGEESLDDAHFEKQHVVDAAFEKYSKTIAADADRSLQQLDRSDELYQNALADVALRTEQAIAASDEQGRQQREALNERRMQEMEYQRRVIRRMAAVNHGDLVVRQGHARARW